jgi:hypothetical protein
MKTKDIPKPACQLGSRTRFGDVIETTKMWSAYSGEIGHYSNLTPRLLDDERDVFSLQVEITFLALVRFL